MGNNAEGRSATSDSYDRVAAEYAERYVDELRHKPLDRALLDWFVGETQGAGTVADVGCGPGQVARYLHERGLPVPRGDAVRLHHDTGGGEDGLNHLAAVALAALLTVSSAGPAGQTPPAQPAPRPAPSPQAPPDRT